MFRPRVLVFVLAIMAGLTGCALAPAAAVERATPVVGSATIAPLLPGSTNTPFASSTPTASPGATATVVPTATLAPTETVAPTATATSAPTATARPTATSTPTATPLPSPSATATAAPSATPTRSPTTTASHDATATSTAIAGKQLAPKTETIGTSVQGRPITATQIGAGTIAVAFVGDTHGGPESATDTLVKEAIVYFSAHTSEIPASITAYFIPTLNPDGLANGTRFNADNVDLNRNFQTSDWSANVHEPTGLVNGAGGPRPFSEPESRAMRDFLVQHHVVASIFYHLPWGGVFGEPNSLAFGQAVALASGYVFHLPGDTPYPLTGTAHRWADENGGRSALLEMHGNAGTEWLMNYRGMLAALGYAARPAQ